MRLSSSTDPTPAASYPTSVAAAVATQGEPGTVIPFNVPSTASFEQALSQAQTPLSQLPATDPTAQGLVPFSNTSMPLTGASAAGFVPFTPTSTAVPFTASTAPLQPTTTAQSMIPFGITTPLQTAQQSGLTLTQWPQMPVATPAAQGLIPLGTSSTGSTSTGLGYDLTPQQGIPMEYMLVPVAAYPAYGSYPGAFAVPFTPYAASGAAALPGTGLSASSVPAGSAAPAYDAAQAPTPAGLHVPFNAPVDVTQGYGPTSVTAEPPLDGYAHFHTGIDFALPSDTPIGAMGAGTVVAAGWDTTGYGNRVIVDHGNGLLTLYAHLDTVDVQVGQQVGAGQQIGLSGSTGNSTGPHLHFGVEVNGSWVNPVPYLQQPSAFTAATSTPSVPITSIPAPAGGALPTTAALTPAVPAASVAPATTPQLASGIGTTADNPPVLLPSAAVPAGASHRSTTVPATKPPQAGDVWPQAQRIQARGGTTQPPIALPLAQLLGAAAPGTAPQAKATPAVHLAQAAAQLTYAQTVVPATAVARQITTEPIWNTTPASGTPAVSVPPASPAASGLTALVQQAAAAAGVPDSLLEAVMQAESSGNPAAVSPSGAKGLMQLMDGTAAQYGVTDPFDAQQSLQGGARYLRDLLDQFNGTTSLAVAAYNAGPGAVSRYGGIPPYPETQTYVNRVLQLQQQYAAQGV